MWRLVLNKLVCRYTKSLRNTPFEQELKFSNRKTLLYRFHKYESLIVGLVLHETNGCVTAEGIPEAQKLFLASPYDKQICILKRALLAVDLLT